MKQVIITVCLLGFITQAQAATASMVSCTAVRTSNRIVYLGVFRIGGFVYRQTFFQYCPAQIEIGPK